MPDIHKNDSRKYEPGYSGSERQKLAASVEYLLRTRGELRGREISGALGSNLTDVGAVLRDLIAAGKVERVQLGIQIKKDRYAYRALSKEEPVKPEGFATPTMPSNVGIARGPGPSNYLWLDGRQVARVTRSVAGAAQDYGRKGYGEIKIEGPSYTEEQRHRAKREGFVLPHTQYMRVRVKVVDANAAEKEWYCEVINPKNVDEYLRWFPMLSLSAPDARS